MFSPLLIWACHLSVGDSLAFTRTLFQEPIDSLDALRLA